MNEAEEWADIAEIAASEGDVVGWIRAIRHVRNITLRNGLPLPDKFVVKPEFLKLLRAKKISGSGIVPEGQDLTICRIPVVAEE